MFSQAWNKYLPIIKILMKRSPNGDQTLDMNRTDFERAAGGRKAKLSFSIILHKGRIQNISVTPPPVARELATVLQEDEVTQQLIRKQNFEFSMNSSFQLLIKNTTPPAEPVNETSESSEDPEASA
jgi:hypothetical protein